MGIQKIAYEIQHMMAKAGSISAPRVTLVFNSDRDKAYFLQEIRNEVTPLIADIKTMTSDLSELKVRGIDFRILS